MESDKPVVVVSGGSRGLGKSLVQACLKKNYRVATFSRTASDEIQRQINADPQQQHFFWDAVDVTKEHSLKTFVDKVLQIYGRIDALVNNVGVAQDGMFTLMRANDINECISFNLQGTIFLTQLCCKVMLRQKQGSVVSISSVNSIRGHSGVSVYSATKSAIDGLTRSLARELGQMNIRINSVAPGYFESDMVAHLNEEQKNRIKRRTPLGRLARMEEIVNCILFLLSPSASFITGQTLVVDGGITC